MSKYPLAFYYSSCEYNYGTIRQYIDIPVWDSLRYGKVAWCGVSRLIGQADNNASMRPTLDVKQRAYCLIYAVFLIVPVVGAIIRQILIRSHPKVKLHPNDGKLETQLTGDKVFSEEQLNHPSRKCVWKEPNNASYRLISSYRRAMEASYSIQRETLKPDQKRCVSKVHLLGSGGVVVAETQGRSHAMEDAFAVNSFKVKTVSGPVDVDLWAVFDGHLGRGAADFCAEHVQAYMKSELEEGHATNRPFDAEFVSNAITRAVVALHCNYGGDSSTTAAITLRLKGKLYVANVGDSRTVLKNGDHWRNLPYINGFLKRFWSRIGYQRVVNLSFDHKLHHYRQEIVEREGCVTWKKNDVPRLNGILPMARAIGGCGLIDHQGTLTRLVNSEGENVASCRPDIVEYETRDIAGNSHLIVASKGLWQAITPEEAVEIVERGKEAAVKDQDIADELVKMAHGRGSPDNITCMLVPL